MWIEHNRRKKLLMTVESNVARILQRANLRELTKNFLDQLLGRDKNEQSHLTNAEET